MEKETFKLINRFIFEMGGEDVAACVNQWELWKFRHPLGPAARSGPRISHTPDDPAKEIFPCILRWGARKKNRKRIQSKFKLNWTPTESKKT